MTQPLSALLTYRVTPTAVPESQTVTLELTVANPTGKFVPCEQIVLTIPTSGSAALTTDPGAINPQPALGTNWSLVGDDAGNFTATPNGTAGLGKNASIAFLLRDVQVVDALGLSLLGIQEVSGTPAELRVLQPSPSIVRKLPGLAITELLVTPIAVCPGHKVTLAWTTTAAEHCTLEWKDEAVTVPTQESGYTVHPETDTTYVLTAVAKGRAVKERVSVAMLSPDIVNFSSLPPQPLDKPNVLRWLVVNAEHARIEPDVGTVDPNHGAHGVTPQQPQQYTLYVGGCGDEHSSSVWVDLEEVEIGSFTATPAAVPPGTPVELAWTTTATTGCSIDPIGPVTGSSVTVTPQQATTYTLEAAGYKPKTAVASVSMLPLFDALLFSFDIEDGAFGFADCAWMLEGADACTVNGVGVSPQDGDVPVTATLGEPWQFIASTDGNAYAVPVTFGATGPISDGFEVTIGTYPPAGYPNVPGQVVAVSWEPAGDLAMSGWLKSGSTTVPIDGQMSAQVTIEPPVDGVLWSASITGTDGAGNSATATWSFPAV